jgi:RNA polymerase-binding protein DksA
MDKKKLEHFKHKLLEERKNVLNLLSRTKNESNEAENLYSDSLVEMSSLTIEREKAYLLASNEYDTLYWIDEALKKIESGGFGLCESCGKEISPTRLEFRPYALYCIDCKEEMEKKHLDS